MTRRSCLFALGCLVSTLAMSGCGGAGVGNGSPPSTSTTDAGDSGGDVGGGDAGGDGSGGKPDALTALFIGNSYTFVNALPTRVHDLAVSAGVPPTIDVRSIVVSSATFQIHWEGTK